MITLREIYGFDLVFDMRRSVQRKKKEIYRLSTFLFNLEGNVANRMEYYESREREREKAEYEIFKFR